MNFVKEPKRKRNVCIAREQPFPVVIETVSGVLPNENYWQFYNGRYNGDCVVIDNPSEILTLYTKGFFGKGSLSKNFPNFGKHKNGIPPFVSERQWKRRCQWKDAVENFQTIHDKEEASLIADGKVENSVGNYNSVLPDLETESDRSNIPSTVSNGDSVAVNGHTIGPQVLPPKFLEDGSEESQPSERPTLPYRPPAIKFRRQQPKKKASCETGAEATDPKTVTQAGGDAVDEHFSSNCDSFSGKTNPSSNSELEKSGEVTKRAERVPCEDSVVVLRDSDSDDEELVPCKLGARLEKDPFPPTEELHLTCEEAFFLSFALGCLRVNDLSGRTMSLRECWEAYCSSQSDFVQKYVTYHHFRSKGWVVKPGVKYGGDFLLYKQGPPFYHASYIVLIEVLEEDDWIRSPTHNRRSISWTQFFATNRLAETVGKEILVCQVVWPATVPQSGPRGPRQLAAFGVREVLLQRWVASQERDDDLDGGSVPDPT